MKHYLAVLMPYGRGWRIHFPDFPGCRADAETVWSAMDRASRIGAAKLGRLRLNGTAPAPRSYQEIRADPVWAIERGIDWSTAVITYIRLD
jgi:predicted RNase H-like HicB family nuclease